MGHGPSPRYSQTQLYRERETGFPPMVIFIVALIIVAVWFGVLLIVLAMCKASGHADADEQRYLAEGCDDVSKQSLPPPSDPTVGGERRSIDREEFAREAERLHIALPERARLRLTHLIGTRRHRP